MWIATKDKLPKFNEFVVFCLNTNLKTVYTGWLNDPKTLINETKEWFADGIGEWFVKEEVLAWFSIPECKITHNNGIHADLAGPSVKE